MPGALTFGGAASDVVECGSAAAIDNLDPFTVIGWFRATTSADNKVLWAKDGSSLEKAIYTQGGGTEIQFQVTRATTNTIFQTSNDPLALNTWVLLACTFNSSGGAANIAHIYAGTLSTPAAECTYGTSADGSGAVATDAAFNMHIGNSNFGGSLASAFVGQVGPLAYFNAVLTLTQIKSWQRRPRMTVGSNVAKRFYRLGKGAANAIEYVAADNGTVTGATQANGPALDQGELLAGVNPNGVLNIGQRSSTYVTGVTGTLIESA